MNDNKPEEAPDPRVPQGTAPAEVGPSGPGAAPEEQERIDTNSDDSFPASDPPSWSPSVATPPDRKKKDPDPIL